MSSNSAVQSPASECYLPHQLRAQPQGDLGLLVKTHLKRVVKISGRSTLTAVIDKKKQRANIARFEFSGGVFWGLVSEGVCSVKVSGKKLCLEQDLPALTGDPGCCKHKVGNTSRTVTLGSPQVVSVTKRGLQITSAREVIETRGNASILTAAGEGSQGHKKTTKQPMKRSRLN